MPSQNPERLQAVNRFLQLDINRKDELQEMVILAAALCYTPIAMITLMDDQTEYIKYGVGTQIKQQVKKDTFCQYLLESDDLMMITDATQDPRFSLNPLVTGEPKIRFYAGCPLITHDGYVVGSLCVMGLIIKQLTGAQKHLLMVMSRRIVEIMELEFSLEILKRQFVQAKDLDVKLRSFFESAGTCHLLLNKKLEIIAFNKNMAQALKANLDIKLRVGQPISQIFKEEALAAFVGECNEALSGNPVNYEREVTYLHHTLWWAVSMEPGYNAEGEIAGVSYNSTDITERKVRQQQIQEENECLLKIAHIQSHEMQIPVASILSLTKLFKSSGYLSTKEELMLLAKAAEDLDLKIRTIVALTE